MVILINYFIIFIYSYNQFLNNYYYFYSINYDKVKFAGAEYIFIYESPDYLDVKILNSY